MYLVFLAKIIEGKLDSLRTVAALDAKCLEVFWDFDVVRELQSVCKLQTEEDT